MPDFDYDAHTRGLLNIHLDKQSGCEECDCDDTCLCECHEDYEPDPDRFRDENPADREDY